MTAMMSAPRIKVNMTITRNEPAEDAKSVSPAEVLGSRAATKIGERMNKAFPSGAAKEQPSRRGLWKGIFGRATGFRPLLWLLPGSPFRVSLSGACDSFSAQCKGPAARRGEECCVELISSQRSSIALLRSSIEMPAAIRANGLSTNVSCSPA